MSRTAKRNRGNAAAGILESPLAAHPKLRDFAMSLAQDEQMTEHAALNYLETAARSAGISVLDAEQHVAGNAAPHVPFRATDPAPASNGAGGMAGVIAHLDRMEAMHRPQVIEHAPQPRKQQPAQIAAQPKPGPFMQNVIGILEQNDRNSRGLK